MDFNRAPKLTDENYRPSGELPLHDAILIGIEEAKGTTDLVNFLIFTGINVLCLKYILLVRRVYLCKVTVFHQLCSTLILHLDQQT